MRQEHILLGFVETVNLVDEQRGGLLVAVLSQLGLRNRFADFLHAGQHGRKIDELSLGIPADQPG